MAMKDLNSGDVKKQEFDDITTCCICTEVFTDPKALPCIHTFCMKCIQETGLKSNKGPGDEMPCPVCRRLFKIPAEGFHGLPKHFFIERLIQMANVSDFSQALRALCDACLEDENEKTGKEIPAADKYCVDCNNKLCGECCSEHRKFKLTKNHKLIPMNEHEVGQKVMTDLAPSVCEVHEQKVLDVYCADCQTVLCAICFIDEHKNHEGSHVIKFVDNFRKQIEGNAEEIHDCSSKAEAKKAKLLKVKEDIQEKVEILESDVEKRKEELKRFADEHATSLLQGLCLIRQSKLKEIQMATDDIDAYISILETYSSYCQKIIAKGSASDICHAFSDLSVRAVELKQQCQPMIEKREIKSFNFSLRKSELEEFGKETCENLFGEIEEEGDSKPKKRSKESLFAEKINEIDNLRKEVEIERTEKESLLLANEQLRISVNEELQHNKTLKANHDSYTVILKQELEKNKTTNTTLQANYDKLNQELNARNMTNKSLQTNVTQLKQELDKEKIANSSLQTDKDKLKQDLGKEKLTNSSLQTIIGQLKQELNKEKIAKNLIQTDKDKLKQYLDTEKWTSNSQHASNSNLVQEVNMYKTTLRTLEDIVVKLKQELETTKTESKKKSLNLEEKLKQEQNEKEKLKIPQSKFKRRLLKAIIIIVISWFLFFRR